MYAFVAQPGLPFLPSTCHAPLQESASSQSDLEGLRGVSNLLCLVSRKKREQRTYVVLRGDLVDKVAADEWDFLKKELVSMSIWANTTMMT